MKTQLALLLAFTSATSALAQMPAPDARLLRFDKNGDGLLTREELPYPNVLKRLDSDGNGLLTREEASQFRGRRRQQPEPSSAAASPQSQPPEDSWFFEAAQFNPSRARAGAVFDIDDDGFDEVVFVGGDQFHVIVNRTGIESSRVFELIAHRLSDADQVRRNVQALSLHDFNNDGHLDLHLGETGSDGSIQAPARVDPAKHGGSVRLNMGDFSFTARSLGNDSYGSTRSVIFDDFDRDGYTDSYHSVAAYWNASPLPNRLLRGTANWAKFGNNVIETMLPDPAFFRDAQGRGVKDFKACIARDFDADGKTDIVTGMMAEIATDPDGPYASWMRGLAVLHNESTPGNIRFADVSHRAIAGAYSDGTKYPQMHVYSIVALDFNRDGSLDLFVTGSRSPAAHLSLESKTDLLRVYRNESRPGQMRFSDVTKQVGLSFFNDQRVARVFPEAPRLFPQLAAGIPADVDNDGYMDVVHVNRRAFHRGDTLSCFVWHNNGGKGFAFVPFDQHGLEGAAREISVGDLNADGQVDIALFHDKAVRLYLNRRSNANHWIKLRTGWAQNRLGIGSRITVYESGTSALIGYDEVRTDVCYRSRRSTTLHFGLGNAKKVDVHVVTPNGRQQLFEKLSTNEFHILNLNQ